MSLFSKLKTVIIRYSIPTLSAVSRLISSPGLTYFTMQKTVAYFYKLFSGNQTLILNNEQTLLQQNNSTAILLLLDDHQSSLQQSTQDDTLPELGYLVFLVYVLPICSNIFINLVTRIPALYRDRTPPHAVKEPFRSPCNQYTYDITYNTLSAMGFCSVLFTIPNAYLGGKKLIKVVTGNDISVATAGLVEIGAIFTAGCNFNTNFSYTYPNFKANAKRFTIFLLDGPNRLISIKQYGKTLILCSFNIVSDPCIAYFSTYNAFKNMPIERLFSDHTMKTIAAYSTSTSFASNVFTSVPSVHTFFNHHHLHPSDNAKMAAMANTISIQVLLKLARFFGFIDSIATGLNSFISVVATMQTILGTENHWLTLIPDFIFEPTLPVSDMVDNVNWHIILWTFATACAASKALSNQAFSVERGIRDTVIKDLYPIYLRNNWIPLPSSAQIEPNSSDDSDSDCDSAAEDDQDQALDRPLLRQKLGANANYHEHQKNTIFSFMKNNNQKNITSSASSYTPPTFKSLP